MMIKTFYGPTLEECIAQANKIGREIVQFQYEQVSNYPVSAYRLMVAFGRLI